MRPSIKGVLCFLAVTTLFMLMISVGHSQEEPSLRIAMCQIFSLDGDRSGNRVRIDNAVREAAAAGAQIVCFPETVMLGWVNPDAHERAHTIPGEDSDFLCRLAKDSDVFLCAGLAEKEGESPNLYDSVVLIDNRGEILLKHRKINILTELMTSPYTPGKDVQVVETKYGKIGLLICADTFKDEILSRMANLEPDLLLVPYGWAAPESKWPAHGKEMVKVVREAALKTGAYVFGTDLVGEITKGPWTGQVYGGQSVAADRNGKLLAVARDRDRDIKIVTLPPGYRK
jgi:predicted amidohydrolase